MEFFGLLPALTPIFWASLSLSLQVTNSRPDLDWPVVTIRLLLWEENSWVLQTNWNIDAVDCSHLASAFLPVHCTLLNAILVEQKYNFIFSFQGWSNHNILDLICVSLSVSPIVVSKLVVAQLPVGELLVVQLREGCTKQKPEKVWSFAKPRRVVKCQTSILGS